MANVSLKNVYKVYDGPKGKDVTAVEDVNIEVQDKEFLVLVGPSGCGKSTTLRMVAGLEEISKGEISIDGRVINNVPPAERDIAMVFQNYALYPHMSVYDNMAFGLKLRKMPEAEIHERVMNAAKILGIEDYLDRKPKALSGGQRQRVAVGRAIVRKPLVFLFDEPLSNLDAKMRVQMRTEILKLHQRLQSTMIYVTHDQIEAMTMGDRIVVMKDGVIQQMDTPLNVYREPANLFVAGFLGSPPMNFIQGTIRKDEQDHLTFYELGQGAFTIRLEQKEGYKNYEGNEVTLGIRPEDLALSDDSASASGDVFEATIDMTEPLGSEANYYINTGQHTLICRGVMPAKGAQLKNEKRNFRVKIPQMHLFDLETQKRIN